jgi:hypothetical protein
MNTTLDLFEAATLSLTRPTPMRDRLADAYRNHLAYINEQELPNDVCEEFRALTLTLTREPPMRGEDALRATVRKMSNDEMADAASAVVRMFCAVTRASTDATREAADKDITNVVPLYAAKA